MMESFSPFADTSPLERGLHSLLKVPEFRWLLDEPNVDQITEEMRTKPTELWGDDAKGHHDEVTDLIINEGPVVQEFAACYDESYGEWPI